jgi:signal transduction histidine kinase
VALTVAGRALRLLVRDDGAGGADPTRGSGLTGLEDRVDALGGMMTVHSPRGVGTSLHVELPLEKRMTGFSRRTHEQQPVRYRGHHP